MLRQKKTIKINSIYFFIDYFIVFWNNTKTIDETKKRKKKHNKLLYLGKNKLDCIEMLISQTIIDQIISHDELKAIINEKKVYGNKKKKNN